jgi:hypothetical protein
VAGFRAALVALSTLAVLALGLADPTTALAATVAVAVAALLAVRVAGVVLGAREVAVGARARSHRQPVVGLVAPAHPATPGRPLGRAPTVRIAAA